MQIFVSAVGKKQTINKEILITIACSYFKPWTLSWYMYFKCKVCLVPRKNEEANIYYALHCNVMAFQNVL